MSELIIKNLPREFKSLEINIDEYEHDRAERFIDNLKEFFNDERLSNDILKSKELPGILDLISKKI